MERAATWLHLTFGGSPRRRSSSTVTSMPRRARSIASVNPTGPPPTIRTSVSMLRTPRSWRASIGLSSRVMEDDAEREAFARAQAADAVAHGHAVDATAALHGPLVDGEDDAFALAQRHHLGARLHARPLLGQHE